LQQGFARLFHRQCRFVDSYSLRGIEIEVATGKFSEHTCQLDGEFFKIVFMLSRADRHGGHLAGGRSVGRASSHSQASSTVRTRVVLVSAR
jgi:hypothetical protein